MDNNNSGLNRDQIAYDAIRDLVGRVLTLSTALIAAAVALEKVIGPDNIQMVPFSVALICFAITILFGLLTLMTVISSIVNGTVDIARNRLVSIMASIHIIVFFLGIVAVIFLAISMNNTPSTDANCIILQCKPIN